MPRAESYKILCADMTYGELVAYTEKHGCRPTIPCNRFCGRESCTDRFRVHCGDVREPYLVKVTQNGADVVNGGSCGMTAEHAQAQAIIRNLLACGKKLCIRVECARQNCSSTFRHIIQVQKRQECVCESYFKDADTGQKNFADVAIRRCGAPKNEKGIVCVIEVYQSHYTAECNRRNIKQWFEVKAKHVLKQYEEQQHRLDIRLDLKCCRMLKRGVICASCRETDRRQLAKILRKIGLVLCYQKLDLLLATWQSASRKSMQQLKLLEQGILAMHWCQQRPARFILKWKQRACLTLRKQQLMATHQRKRKITVSEQAVVRKEMRYSSTCTATAKSEAEGVRLASLQDAESLEWDEVVAAVAKNWKVFKLCFVSSSKYKLDRAISHVKTLERNVHAKKIKQTCPQKQKG